MGSRIKSFSKKLVTGFIAASLIVGALSVLSYTTIRQNQVADKWVAHTLDVINAVNRIHTKLSEAEKGKIYYLLNRRAESLGKYTSEVRSINRSLHDLRKLVADNKLQVKRIDSLISYLSRIPSGIQLAYDAQKLNDLKGIEHYLSGNVQNVTDIKSRAVVDQIIQAERQLLIVRKNTSQVKADSALTSIVIYSLVIQTLLVFLFIFIFRTFRSRASLLDQLQLSESKFFKAFNNSGSGMALVSAKGAWLEVNPMVLSVFGYNKEELETKSFEDLTHPEDLHKDLDLLKQLLKGEVESYRVEKRYIKKDGSLIWALLSVSLIQKEDGAPRFFVLQIEDITELKLLVAEQEDRNKVLQSTSKDLENKISQLEEFNRIVAHNLRGPAGSIQMMLEMMDDDNSEAEKEELLSLILVSSKSLNSTLADLMQVLEIRLKSSIKFDSCDLSDILLKSKEMLQGQILLSRAMIRTNFELAFISFPRMYIESLFYNLLSNSLKYRRPDIPLEVKISSTLVEGKIKLVFEDNGLGIDLNVNGKNMFKLNKVFHKGFDSRGVGLFITKNQLETHGASIGVESEPMVGTKFTITF
jgi:PAS domain S-box-containing protein